MSFWATKTMFDQQDHELLTVVNEVLARERSRKYLKNLFIPYLHANGIKELAAPKELRIAYAVIHLLDILEAGGGPEERLTALRSARDEVLHYGQGTMRNNTGRVLLQIMKELIRAHGQDRKQLELAHDFRTASSGKPRLVRALLQRHHLLEMPEEWNQLAFDDHIHDANTKGRKSPTHLIMDAWIKGIRALTVIHYNFIRPAAAAELLQAAEIMGLTVRIGLEFSARFRGKYVQLIWVPFDFARPQDFLQFLTQPEVAKLMNEGLKVSGRQGGYILALLASFNQRHLPELETRLGLTLEPLSRAEFLTFVGPGQPSLLHLSKFIHLKLLPAMRARTKEIQKAWARSEPQDHQTWTNQIQEMDALDSDAILTKFLGPESNPDLADPGIPEDSGTAPSLLAYTPCDLARDLNRLHAGSRITLNLSNLVVEDVLEMLYDCRGNITHLEIMNLKDHAAGRRDHLPDITELKTALNEGNILQLKRIIKGIIRRLEAGGIPGCEERAAKLHEILRDIGSLRDHYRTNPLKSRIGSDSTGQSAKVPGMGLAVVETLPHRAGNALNRKDAARRLTIPIQSPAYLRATFVPREGRHPWAEAVFSRMRQWPGLHAIGLVRREEWVAENASIRLTSPGNIVSLGRPPGPSPNGLRLVDPESEPRPSGWGWAYLNSGLKNTIKVAGGFVPAALTFAHTADWWVLAWFGAVIWFMITGLRNIIQSVVGGGGISRSPLLRWKDYVSWGRVADSLFFTGFSVPLLEYVVKTVLLDRNLGINTSTNPLVLYGVMALANGLYISSHNHFRGLPSGAVYANFFRSVVSIPLALALNALTGMLLTNWGVVAVDHILQKWAAIISKAASDCVAAIIEGAADRAHNLRQRAFDYQGKLAQIFDVFARLELRFPEADVLELLKNPKESLRLVKERCPEMGEVLIINSLDLLYFWMYQPRGRSWFKDLIPSLTPEEREVLNRSQLVLRRHREVSQMFVDGLVGRRFSRALAFYLDRWEEYLEAMTKLMEKEASFPESGSDGQARPNT